MNNHHLSRLATLMVTAGAVGLAACAGENSPTSTKSPSTPSFAVGDPVTPGTDPTVGQIVLCKTGNVDGTFTITNTPTNGGTPSVVASPVTVTTGTCQVIVEDFDGTDIGSFTTITETSAGMVSASARFYNGADNTVSDQPYTDGSTQLFTNNFHGWTVTYNNNVELPPPPPPPPALEGCSPGYWKTHTTEGAWPAAYTPGTLFSAVFEDAFPGKTLLQVLSTGGGGLTALGRQTVGALLNAESLGASFGMTATEVIDAFNAVYPGTKSDYTALQGQFESMTDTELSGRTCPLN